MEFLTFLPANLGSLYPVACCFLCQISFGLCRQFCWRGSKKLFPVLLYIVQDEAVELGCWFFFELPKRIIKDPLPFRSWNALEKLAASFDIGRHLHIGKEGGSLYKKIRVMLRANAHQCRHHGLRIAAARVVEELPNTSVPDFAGEEP